MSADESLIFYNEAGEVLLGQPFAEAADMKLDDLPNMFQMSAEDGSPMPLAAFPLSIALRQQRTAHQLVRYQALDGVWRSAGVTGIPLENHEHRHIGAMCFWWEVPGR